VGIQENTSVSRVKVRVRDMVKVRVRVWVSLGD